MAYHGKSGAAENSARDQEFFLNGGLDGRAEALGYDANASISVGDDISTDGLYQEIETYHFVSKPLELLGVKNVNAPPERYGHILAEHDGTRRYDDKGRLKSVFAKDLQSYDSMVKNVFMQILGNPDRIVMQGDWLAVEGNLTYYSGTDNEGNSTRRVRIILQPIGPGDYNIYNAYPIKGN